MGNPKPKFCPLLKADCKGQTCALWVTGDGFSTGCAIAVIATETIFTRLRGAK